MPFLRSCLLAAALSGALLGALPAQGLTWWQKSFDEALAAAKDAKGGMVLLYCWRKDDGYCSSMFGGTFADAKVQAAVADYVCMGAEDAGATKVLLEKYGVQKVPTVLFVDPAGKVVDVVVGYLPVQDFLVELQRIAKGEKTIAALEQAFAVTPPAADGTPYLPQIVFVTDGEPTMGLTNPQQILELTKRVDGRAMRLFALGVGDDIDVRLIDDLVLQHRGARDFVDSREKIEAKVGALCQKLAQPALTDVTVRCDGIDVFDVQPTRTRDLFCGEQMQITGRYRGDGKKRVVVQGTQDGKVREYAFEVEFPAVAPEREFVQTLWARQQVAALLDGIRRNGQKPELLGELRKLATRYGIVTPFTSQLIVEEGMRLQGQVPTTAFDSNRWNESAGGVRDGLGGGAGRWAGGPGTGGPVPPGARTATGPAGPASPGPARVTGARAGSQAVAESKAATGSDDFYLGAVRRFAGDRGAAAPAAEAATADAQKNAPVRRAAGRVFLQAGENLVEQELPADWSKTAVVVEAFGDAYFALLAADPKLRDVLALGDRIVFRDGTRIVHVQPAKAK